MNIGNVMGVSMLAVAAVLAGCGGGGGGGGGTPAGSPEPSPAPPSGLPAAVRIDTGGGSSHPLIAGNATGQYIVRSGGSEGGKWQNLYLSDAWTPQTQLDFSSPPNLGSQVAISKSGVSAVIFPSARDSGERSFIQLYVEGAPLPAVELPIARSSYMRDSLPLAAGNGGEIEIAVTYARKDTECIEIAQYRRSGGWAFSPLHEPDATCAKGEPRGLAELPDGRWILTWIPDNQPARMSYSLWNSVGGWAPANTAFEFDNTDRLGVEEDAWSHDLRVSTNGTAWLTWVNAFRELRAVSYDSNTDIWGAPETVFQVSRPEMLGPQGIEGPLHTVANPDGRLSWVFAKLTEYESIAGVDPAVPPAFYMIEGRQGAWGSPVKIAESMAVATIYPGFTYDPRFASNHKGDMAISVVSDGAPWALSDSDRTNGGNKIIRYSSVTGQWTTIPFLPATRELSRDELPMSHDVAMDDDGNIMVVWSNLAGELWSRKIPR